MKIGEKITIGKKVKIGGKKRKIDKVENWTSIKIENSKSFLDFHGKLFRNLLGHPVIVCIDRCSGCLFRTCRRVHDAAKLSTACTAI